MLLNSSDECLSVLAFPWGQGRQSMWKELRVYAPLAMPRQAKYSVWETIALVGAWRNEPARVAWPAWLLPGSTSCRLQ